MKSFKELEFSCALAEVLGIICGDGCIYLDSKKKYQVAIAFNKMETPYLYYVKNLLEQVFRPYKFCITEIRNEILLRNNSVYVGKQLINVGLLEGNKVKNKLQIPWWIHRNNDFLARFIRGYFDTDGCIYKKYGKYAQIQFKSACKEIILSVQKALLKLGYSPTNLQQELYSGLFSWKIYLIKQKEIENFFKEISPMNRKHNQRYVRIKHGDAGTFELF